VARETAVDVVRESGGAFCVGDSKAGVLRLVFYVWRLENWALRLFYACAEGALRGRA
jgi:hypothetical protein